jgi:hypothetical protein
VEYVALTEATQEAIWIERLMRDFKEMAKTPTNSIIFENNQSCIKVINSDKSS